MYRENEPFTCPYFMNAQMYPCPYFAEASMYNQAFFDEYNEYDDTLQDTRSEFENFEDLEDADRLVELKDYGPKPYVVNIEEATKQNNNFRTTLWTGRHLQVTLMSIRVGEDIGLEIHPNVDQFIRVEAGQGIAKMGNRRDNLNFQRRVSDGFAIMIPAGTWHNIINTGNTPLKVYSIYAPPQHPFGTVHKTKAEASAK